MERDDNNLAETLEFTVAADVALPARHPRNLGDMSYDERSLKKIAEKYQDTGRIHDQLMVRLGSLHSKLTNDKANEYLMQGAGRRLKILRRCLVNIFGIFPIGQAEHLAQDELTDLEINLHAFVVNVSGLFDNLGWVFACEHDLLGKRKDGKLGKNDIGLFNLRTQILLPEPLREYLQSDRLRSWYTEYSKNYRDALAHRIPLYVPPAVLSGTDLEKYLQLETQLQKCENLDLYDHILEQQNQLGEPSLVFAQSVGEGGRPVFLHAQVIADYATIREVFEMFCEHCDPKAP